MSMSPAESATLLIPEATNWREMSGMRSLEPKAIKILLATKVRDGGVQRGYTRLSSDAAQLNKHPSDMASFNGCHGVGFGYTILLALCKFQGKAFKMALFASLFW
uniref:Uncharacterized protein n=1 Tax=Panagrellus redivivus TaxID=6233 RepID=A0A7E4W6I9_PANRE